MKLGISTASFYPLETEYALLEIAKNHIPCTEIFYNAKKELKPYFTDKILEIKNEFGIDIVAIHPMMSLAEPYTIFSDYERRFDEAREEFLLYFETAATIGARFINLHGDKKFGKLENEEYFERFGILAEDAKSFGVTLCQENVNAYRSADPEFLREMSSYLGDLANFTFDIKQSIRAGYSTSEILEAMGNKIRHIHISDHSPACDCLLPLSGGFNFKDFFKTLSDIGYDGALLIEVYKSAYKNTDEIFESLNLLKKQTEEYFK